MLSCSQAILNKIESLLNEQPRKTLQFETPAEHSTHVLHRTVEVATHSGHSGLTTISLIFLALYTDYGLIPGIASNYKMIRLI